MKSVLVILGILFGLNLLAWVAVGELAGSGGLEVVFFDVGQGDAALIETPSHQQILIDGGPSGERVLEKLGDEMPFWDRNIDLIILTHPERDHMAGLIEVLKRYEVQNILWTGVLRDTAEYEEWLRLIKKEGARIYIAQANQKLSFSEKLSFLILFPFESLEGRKLKDSNNTSIVARLVFGETSFLFTGDAPQSVEKELVLGPTPHKAQLEAEVLKVGHHGSKTATAQEFVEAVSPEMAVISVGKDNSYGHPYQETLDTLEKYGINILRTDLEGNIKIVSDGKDYLSHIQN